MKILNQPSQIVEVVIPEPPKIYEGFLYRFTNLDNQIVYVGVHKGTVDDGYWHSATDVDFQKDLASTDGKFKYEIMKYGDYDRMTVDEHNILKNADASNNPYYYNKTVGSPKYKTVRTGVVEKIVKDIKSDKYQSVKEHIDSVKGLMRKQVRVEDFSSHEIEIGQKIDENTGTTDHLTCYTIILNSEETIIGGNHSIRGVVKSKHGHDINIVRIPEKVTKNLNDAEITLLGNLLNKRDEFVKKELSEPDSKKQVMTNFEELGTPAMDESNKEMLVAMGWTKKKSTAIMKKVAKEIDDKVASMAGKVRIDWGSGSHKKKLEKMMQDATTPTRMVFTQPSGMFRVDRILKDIYDINTGRELTGELEKTDVWIYIRHSNELHKNDWRGGLQLLIWKQMKYWWREEDGRTIDFKDLPLYEDDMGLIS